MESKRVGISSFEEWSVRQYTWQMSVLLSNSIGLSLQLPIVIRWAQNEEIHMRSSHTTIFCPNGPAEC